VNTLQSLVFPNLDLRVPEDLYLRLGDGAWADLAKRRVAFEAGSVMSTDTFFNGFSIGAWKRRCDLGSLSLRIAGSGEFVCTIGWHRFAQVSVWLAEHHVVLDGATDAELALPQWAELGDGMLFLRLRALTPGTIRAAAFATAQASRNDVRLGLVITHFNRQAQVTPAIDRIRAQLLERPELEGRVTLTVVDNSRNLQLAAHPAIEYIPNRNLGGTGGFVRGLLALIDGGRHTHALFMDDDASCETESIARALALLQHGREKRLAVAGALLREIAPWELLEKGARFDGKVVPLNSGLDMRQVPDLLHAERNVARPDYGAWWFFAFPIAEIRQFPFPFFVRGDDVLFGLGNRFEITTLNGVACLGEDFGAKHGPLTAYLDARYHLVHAFLDRRGAAPGVFWVGSRLFVKALTSYQYASARAVTLAMRHVLQGPAFFRDNLDMQRVRAEIAAFEPSEKMGPIDRGGIEVKGARARKESKGRRLLRVLTLQGFLLPGWLLLDRTTVQVKGFHGTASAVFRYRRVLYEHLQSGTGFIARYDRRRFFAELAGFFRAWWPLFRNLPSLRRAYAQGIEQMTTLAFWREVYPETGRRSFGVPADERASSVEAPAAQLEQLRVEPAADVA
jgi:GT2 family glycosyltransferase